MGDTAIGWTHRPGTRGRTWNPVRGCSRVSEGCRHCYAEAQAARIVRMGKGKPTAYDGLVKLVNGEPRWTGEVRIVADHLADPLKWRQPSTVFVNSMSDLFHESLTNEQIAAVFGVMAACPQHTFQVLTKRARRMREWFEITGIDDLVDRFRHIALAGRIEQVAELRQLAADGITGAELAKRFGISGTQARNIVSGRQWTPEHKPEWPLRSVWIGVSVENQDAADERIPDLLATPAAIRFLSCEPLLGPVTLPVVHVFGPSPAWEGPRIGWVIDGCESGPNARPAQREWFASLEEQCRSAGVPYFHKQEMVDGKLVHDFPGRQEWPA